MHSQNSKPPKGIDESGRAKRPTDVQPAVDKKVKAVVKPAVPAPTSSTPSATETPDFNLLFAAFILAFTGFMLLVVIYYFIFFS